MTNSLQIITGTVNPTNQLVNAARTELQEIFSAGAKALKPAGYDLQPVKADMLNLPTDQAALVIEACDMLFAALFEFEDGTMAEQHATNSADLVKARIAIGRADAVIKSLLWGPCGKLLWIAMDRAPIAFCGLARISPSQHLIDRVSKLAPK